jgi:hypothetical protein
MEEDALIDALAAVQKGFRRVGREMVLSSTQALLRGILVLLGVLASYGLMARAPDLLSWVWGGIAGVLVILELIMYFRLIRSTPGKFITGLERQIIKFLLLLIFAGAVLSAVFVQHGDGAALPALWMLVIGIAYSSVGFFSFSDTWILGLYSCAGGAIAFFVPPRYSFGILGLVLGAGSIVWSWVLRRREKGIE